MKTKQTFKCPKIRNLKNKFILFSLMYLFLSLFSCQTAKWADNYTLSEKMRIQHARELLSDEYDRLNLSNLEFDYDFDEYLKKYVTKMNPNIETNAFISNLLLQSKNQNFDPVFVIAVMKTESQFNTHAIGRAGEIGLMQIKPSTAEWFCEKMGLVWKGPESLKDPIYNLEIGTKYFKYLKNTLKSKSSNYINAYNMGLNNLQRLPSSVKKAHPYYHRVIRNYIEIYGDLKKIQKNEIKS